MRVKCTHIHSFSITQVCPFGKRKRGFFAEMGKSIFRGQPVFRMSSSTLRARTSRPARVTRPSAMASRARARWAGPAVTYPFPSRGRLGWNRARVHFFIAAENPFRSTGAHHYNTDGGKCDALFRTPPLFAGPLAPPVFLCYHAESPSQGVLRQHGKDTDR